jgi:voltage-gated potassium channel
VGAEREPSGPSRASGAPRSGQIAVGLLRTLLTVVAMVVVYYLAPLGRAFDLRLGIWLVVGLVALGVAVGWQIRAIAVSETPRLRAAETVAVALPFLIVLFAAAYTLMSHYEPASFTEALNRTDALYFTMTVFATVGFGDIAPVTEQARIFTMAQMVVGLAMVGLVAKLLLGAVQHAVGTKESAARESAARESARESAQQDQQPQT